MAERSLPKCGIKIYLGAKKPDNLRYINCEQLHEFPKTIYYEKLVTRYRLKQLRAALNKVDRNKKRQPIIKGLDYEIKDFDTVTEEQRLNRKNPEYHQQLKEAHVLRERAIMQNDRGAEKELSKTIEELKDKLGYKDRVTPEKYQKQLRDTVTNAKPFRGRSCTSK